MAIDGYVDIRALFNKTRLNDIIDDGKGVVEAHAEFEAAMCEAFGIENGLNISASILGTVAADGSWSMARFSRKSPTHNASNAVGWEFRNPQKAVRLAQVSGTIQIWEEQFDGTWDQVRDLEYLKDGSILDLKDVRINSIPDPDTTTATTVAVIGNSSSQGFGLSSDTTTSGSDTFKDMTDVYTPIFADYLLGAEGAVMESYDDDGTSIIKSKLIPALLGDALPNIGMLVGQMTMHPFKPIIGPDIWQTPVLGSDLVDWITVDDENRILLSKDGVYKISFMWKLESGSTESSRVDDGGGGPSAIALYLSPGAAISTFPPKETIYLEPPWNMVLMESIIPRPRMVPSYYDWPLYKGTSTDGFTLLAVSNGGETATLEPKWAHSITGGDRQFTIWMEVERLN